MSGHGKGIDTPVTSDLIAFCDLSLYQSSPFTKFVLVLVVNTVVKYIHWWSWSFTAVHHMAPGAPCGERIRAQSS